MSTRGTSMVMRTVVSLAGLWLLIGACGGSSRPLSPTVATTFVLSPGQIGSTSGASVKFVRVVSDSRCPLNAQCVQAGDVVVTVTLIGPSQAATFDLQLADSAKRTGALGGLVVELQAVTPYPIAGQPTNPADYRATIELRPG